MMEIPHKFGSWTQVDIGLKLDITVESPGGSKGQSPPSTTTPGKIYSLLKVLPFFYRALDIEGAYPTGEGVASNLDKERENVSFLKSYICLCMICIIYSFNLDTNIILEKYG